MTGLTVLYTVCDWTVLEYRYKTCSRMFYDRETWAYHQKTFKHEFILILEKKQPIKTLHQINTFTDWTILVMSVEIIL